MHEHTAYRDNRPTSNCSLIGTSNNAKHRNTKIWYDAQQDCPIGTDAPRGAHNIKNTTDVPD